MSAVTKNVFLLITADSCSHCTNFKKFTWNDLRSSLESTNKLHVYHVNLPSMRLPVGNFKDSNGNIIPEAISKHIKWFPMMMLIPMNSWKESFRNKEINVDIYDTSRRVVSKDILSWVQDNLNKPEYSIIPSNRIQRDTALPTVTRSEYGVSTGRF